MRPTLKRAMPNINEWEARCGKKRRAIDRELLAAAERALNEASKPQDGHLASKATQAPKTRNKRPGSPAKPVRALPRPSGARLAEPSDASLSAAVNVMGPAALSAPPVSFPSPTAKRTQNGPSCARSHPQPRTTVRANANHHERAGVAALARAYTHVAAIAPKVDICSPLTEEVDNRQARWAVRILQALVRSVVESLTMVLR
jgi:hypothetical protein